MAVTKMPGRKPTPTQEAAAAKFIEGASAPVWSGPAADSDTAVAVPGARRTPAMIRFDAALLARVDRAARRRGVSRSAWVAFTLSKALDDEEATG
jgi:hypothetical protein